MPKTLFSSARHENRTDDPDDTLILDDVVRFAGQRVAFVVAESVGIAEAACRLLDVQYDVLPANFDPARAREAGTPLLHADKDAASSRIADPANNLVAEMRGEYGSIAEGLARADVTVTGTWQTQRISASALETHGTVGWVDEDGRLVLRTSSQVPFLVQKELSRILEIDVDRIRVYTARVGGGFGGKQEIQTEDLVALAVLKTGRPVQYEMTRNRRTHRGALPAPHDLDGHTRCHSRRPPHRHRSHHAERHRRLRQPRPRNDVPRLRRVDQHLQLPEQARERRVRLHEQHALRRLSGVRTRPGDLRGRVGDG